VYQPAGTAGVSGCVAAGVEAGCVGAVVVGVVEVVVVDSGADPHPAGSLTALVGDSADDLDDDSQLEVEDAAYSVAAPELVSAGAPDFSRRR
jgi:hypothetical protein